MHLNVSSLLSANRFEMLKLQLKNMDVDIFGLSETWLTDAILDGLIMLDGYNHARLDRSWNDNGGVGPAKR